MNIKKDRIKYLSQAYLFLLPAAVLLIVFLYYPVVKGINYSFYSFKNFLPDKFVGLMNYSDAFHDQVFWNSIYLTFKWVFMNAFIPTFTGLLLALLLEYFTRKWLTGISRTVLFMPMMMSMVSVGLLWTLIYDPNLGLLNGLLHILGYTGKFSAYGNLNMALYMTFIPVVWQSSGFSMVVFSAALQAVSKDMLESSMIEGANKLNQVRYIMIPSIIKTITMIVIVNMIAGFKAFDLLYVLTRGGPGMSTEITAVYAYKQAFFAFKFEYASTMTVCLLICVIFFLFAFNFVSGKIERRFGA
jgi:raffinose/stachyose/melibiose transport system permease protein